MCVRQLCPSNIMFIDCMFVCIFDALRVLNVQTGCVDGVGEAIAGNTQQNVVNIRVICSLPPWAAREQFLTK